MTAAKDWWGYDNELNTWVYLDRSIINNQPNHSHLQLIFVNCRDETTFNVNTKEWNEPRFQYEKVFLTEKDDDSEILNSFKTKVSFYRSIVKPLEHRPQVRVNEAVSDRNVCSSANQNKPLSNGLLSWIGTLPQSEQKEMIAWIEGKSSSPISDNKTFRTIKKISPVKRSSTQPLSQKTTITPEEIRELYAQNYSDCAWGEVISYVALMERLGIRDQGKCNEHITRTRQWDSFPNIRAMNDHGYGREFEGITRSAYSLVCKLINLQNGNGAPLLQSRKY